MPDPRAVSRKLLTWYDANARVLPWRVGPAARKAGAAPDPYRVWLSEIMLQQTTVATVAPRFEDFIARWPQVEDMAAAPIEDILGQWAGLGYYARARNLHKCARVVADGHKGAFPREESALRELPGVGPYTAAAIAAIAFDAPGVVMDGNIERVSARLFAIDTPLPKAKPELRDAIASVWPGKRSGDFAQALMDLGARVCRPRNPDCGACPLSPYCAAFAGGVQNDLPNKQKKAAKPTRRGVAYALVNHRGEMLFERRPEKGLLGGMLGLPGSDWREGEPAPAPPAHAKWTRAGAARHTFTHFHLELEIMRAPAPKGFRANNNQSWIAPEKARLPTVMKKAVEKALG
ncbi:MAG: A/G-specific adenine glycosylase [Parvularculaceae bacterium]